MLNLRIAFQRQWKKLINIVKNSQFKIRCLECEIVFDNDQPKEHNERWHDDMSQNSKHIKWKQADAVQNPFETWKKKKSKISKEYLTLSQSINEIWPQTNNWAETQSSLNPPTRGKRQMNPPTSTRYRMNQSTRA